MMSLARLFKHVGYETADIQVSFKKQRVEVYLQREDSKEFVCNKCGTPLKRKRGQHSLELRDLSILGLRCYIKLIRLKGHCPKCRKARVERVEFMSEFSPHYTKRFTDWIGTLCEFASVSKVAWASGVGIMTVKRIDLTRLKTLVQKYEIPDVKAISVDEVYARKKSKFKGESRNKKFFTIITDLDTHRVIWVSESRDKQALDQFFTLLGEFRSKKIKIVAMDQHEAYAASVKEYCPNARIVWDKFHIMKSFEEAVNETRKDLHSALTKDDPILARTRGKYRFIFLKKADRRSKDEKNHIDQVFLENSKFLELELIKEKMLMFFDQSNEEDAKEVLDEATMWAWQANFTPLRNWFANIHEGWETLKNYFQYRVTSALSEGINNVIKTLKRRSYGYRDMDYFRYKIMQVCGYLNSGFVLKERIYI